MLAKEVENHVAALAIVGRIHRHFAEKIFDFGVYHRQSAQTVPKIVEGIESFGTGLRRLVFGAHEGSAEFNGLRQIIAHKFGRKIKHVGRGNAGRSIRKHGYVVAADIAVAAENEPRIGIPDHELTAGGSHGVKFIDVTFLAGATAC